MTDKPEDRCLHCEISDLVGEHIRAGLSINEILFKQIEVIADLIAGIGDRNGRRQFLDDCDKQLRRMTSRAVLQRQADGAPNHTTMKMQ